MSEIDYEPLAKEVGSIHHETYEDVARAVVAAYRTQQQFHGIMEVRVDRLRNMMEQNGRFLMSDAGFAHLIENWQLTEGID